MNSIEVQQSRIGTMLPQEIIEYIWNINYIWASNIINKHVKYFIEKNRKMLIMKYYYEYAAIIYNNELNHNTENARYIVNICNKCNCCERHKRDRPTTLEPWIENDSQTPWPPYGPPQHCSCPCRHLSRFVCRHSFGVLHVSHHNNYI